MSVLRRQTLMRLFTDIFAYQKKHPTNMWTRIYTCSHIGTYEFTFITYWRSKKTAWKMNPSICDLMQVLTMYIYSQILPFSPCYLSQGAPSKDLLLSKIMEMKIHLWTLLKNEVQMVMVDFLLRRSQAYASALRQQLCIIITRRHLLLISSLVYCSG